MKTRKSLLLSREAIARGEQLAAERGQTLSAVIEAQLLAAPFSTDGPVHYWCGRPLRALKRPGDPRGTYLKRKHGR